jgi:tetratricopeptide (TPR) repeat protein
MGRWRESRLLLIVTGLAVLGAASGVLTIMGVKNVWILSSGAVVTAVVTVAAGVWQNRYKQVAQRRDEQSLKVEEGCLVLASGRLPKVRQIRDPITLGVHPSTPAQPAAVSAGKSVRAPRVPTYVPRDIDGQLRECLTKSGFVVLVGHSTAGKSRSAYEAMAVTLAEHVLIAPSDRGTLSVAVAKAAETKMCVLWLNDLENFLGGGAGLSRTQVTKLVSGDGHHRVILSTLRAAEERRFAYELEGADDSTRVMNQQARETLEQAYRIGVERLFSSEEQDRATARSWDPRIADAVKNAGQYGIAEYLAAGPEVLRDMDNAWEAGANPRGAALVAAAIDCRRAGYFGALPKQLLEDVHEMYLEKRGGHRLRPEGLDEAWAWAMRSRRSTTALLQRATGDDVVDVFDYLVDDVQRRASLTEQVPEQVIISALRYASTDDADTIADMANAQGRYSLAAQAWTLAYQGRLVDQGHEHPDTLTSRSNLASTLRHQGRLEEAEAEHRTILGIRRRVLGDEHPDTLTSRANLAFVLRHRGRLEEAEAEHRAVLEIRRRVLGEEDEATLRSRSTLASVLRHQGRLEEAEAEHQAVLEIRQRVLGEEHPATLKSRSSLAIVVRYRGRLEEAEAEHRAVLEIRRRVLGEEHPDTLTSRSNLASMLRHQGRLEEAEAEHRTVLEIRRRIGIE